MNNEICVVDGSSENLNTSMTIKIEDQEVIVWLCDDCAEDTSVRTARDAYLLRYQDIIDKNREVAETVEKAKALGLEVSVPPQLTLPGAKTKIETEQKEKPTTKESAEQKPKQKPSKQEQESKWIDSKEAEALIKTPKVSSASSNVQASAGSAYSIKTESEVSEDLTEGEQAEMGIVEGRQGVPIRIPIAKRGKMGTTTIRVQNNVNDKALQEQFKRVANASIDGNFSYNDGYKVQFIVCPLCEGSGVKMGKQCPKCKGGGEIQTSL